MYLGFGATKDETTFKEIECGRCFFIQNNDEDIYMKLKLSEDEEKTIPYNAVNLGDGTVRRLTDGSKVYGSEVGITIDL